MRFTYSVGVCAMLETIFTARGAVELRAAGR